MISKTSKCDGNVLQSLADFVYNNEDFRRENFPFCSSSSEVKVALASQGGWYTLESDGAAAVFKLEIAVPTANVKQICVNHAEFLTGIIMKLRDELNKMKVTNATVRIPFGLEKRLTDLGLDKRSNYVKYSRVPEETRMMPILPLMNVSRKELPILSKLMFESYSKSPQPLLDTITAEKILQSIMSGVRGEYISTASFASGAAPNLVSACFLTRNSSEEAEISELFTHPLYRARGLATTEIALAMNRLATDGVRKLVAWNADENAIVNRLLTKMGFREVSRVAEMAISP